MQTSVQKTDSVRFGSGVLEIDTGGGYVNIGMITDAVMEMAMIIKQFIGSNAKMDPLSRIESIMMNFNMYELDLTFLDLVNGNFDLTNVAGTPVSIIGEALGTGWTIGLPLRLANKNGDNLEVDNIVIDAAGTPLVLDTDYKVYVGDGENGDLGYTYITPLTTQAGILDADYDYTPNASKVAEFGDSDRELPLYAMRFTHTYPGGEIFQIELFKGFNEQGLSITFNGDEDEDPASVPVSIKAFPDSSKGGTVNLFKITDEKSLT